MGLQFEGMNIFVIRITLGFLRESRLKAGNLGREGAVGIRIEAGFLSAV